MTLTQDLKSFSAKCKRVWLAMKKPTRKEFEQVAKVSAVGILLLGLIGYTISLFMELAFF